MSFQQRRVFLAPTTTDFEAVNAFAQAHGLSLISNQVITWQSAESIWENDDLGIDLMTLNSGEHVVRLRSNDVANHASVVEDLNLESCADVLAREAVSDEDAIDHVYAMWATMFIEHDEAEQCREAMTEYYEHPRDLVRWVAGRALATQGTDGIINALERAAQTYPEMGVYAEQARAAREQRENAPVETMPFRDMVSKCKEALAADDFEALLEWATQAFEERPASVDVQTYLAIAFWNLGQRAMGFAFAEAARNSFTESKVDAELPTEWDGTGEVDIEYACDICVKMRANGATKSTAALAKALVQLPDADARLHYVAGSYSNEFELLKPASETVQDSGHLAYRLFCAMANEDATPDEELIAQAHLALKMYDQPPESDLAKWIETFMGEPPSMYYVFSDASRNLYKRKLYDECATVCDTWLELDPDDVTAWQRAVNSRIFGDRWSEALEIYPEVIANVERIYADPDRHDYGSDGRPLMYFNYACLLSDAGRYDEAFEALRTAIRGDVKWAEAALEDETFAGMADQPRFQALTSLDPVATALPEELTEEHMERLLQYALGRGGTDEAFDVLDECIVLATAANLELQVAKAQSLLSWNHAYYGDPKLAAELGLSAIETFEASGDQEELAAAYTSLGGAYLQLERLDEAEDCLKKALAIRIELVGEEHPILAKPLGTLARIEDRRGNRKAAIEKYEAVARHLDTYIADGSEERDGEITWGDALYDRSVVHQNLLHWYASEQNMDACFAKVQDLVDALEPLYADRFRNEPAVTNAYNVLDWLMGRADGPDIRELQVLQIRLDELGLSTNPVVREEQRYWIRVRRLVDDLVNHGGDTMFAANVLAEAVRGDADEQLCLRFPELGSFKTEMAMRMNRIPTFSVTCAMALSLAQNDGDIDRAIDDLSAICISEAGIDSAS